MDWSGIGMTILSYVLPIIAVALTTVITWGLTKLAKKWGIQLDLTKDSALRLAVRTAIGGAEEYAARKFKVDEEKVDAAVKTKYVHSRVSKLWPNLLPDDLDGIIDEELSVMAGVGATGSTVVGVLPAPLDADTGDDE